MKLLKPLLLRYTFALGAASLCMAAQAHGIWFSQRAGELALIYGHGPEDLGVIKRQEKIKSFAAFDMAQKPLESKLVAGEHLLTVASVNKPVLLAAMLDNGFWSKGPDGKWQPKPKDEVAGAKESGHYLKYTVSMPVPGRQLPDLQPIEGHRLQLFPVGKLFPVTLGQTLKLKVLFDGKPAVGAKVHADFVNDVDGRQLVVGKAGVVSIRVRNQGLNVIAAQLHVAAEDKTKADTVEHLSTFSFVLATKPE